MTFSFTRRKFLGVVVCMIGGILLFAALTYAFVLAMKTTKPRTESTTDRKVSTKTHDENVSSTTINSCRLNMVVDVDVAADILTSQDFVNDEEIIDIIQSLKEDGIDQKVFSDVVDNQGNQYVDCMFGGGGVYGVIMIGWLAILEEMNIRCLKVGGVSAGSIVALMIASDGPIDQKKSLHLLDHLGNKDFMDFIDGPPSTEAISLDLVEAHQVHKFQMIVDAALSVKDLNHSLGLNTGDHATQWLNEVLKKHGIQTNEDLQRMRNKGPSEGVYLTLRSDISKTKITDTSCWDAVALIATDVTTQTRTVFPMMADLYFKDPNAVSAALFCRASMSMPGFFCPLVIKNIPQGRQAKDTWKRRVAYTGTLPQKVTFIDGGACSALPLDVFHVHSKSGPRAPTFGVELLAPRDIQETDTVSSLAWAIFNTSRQVDDYEFIKRNPELSQLMTCIRVGNDTMKFSITRAEKMQMLRQGAREAAKFLRKFDWQHYKTTRNRIDQNRVQPH